MLFPLDEANESVNCHRMLVAERVGGMKMKTNWLSNLNRYDTGYMYVSMPNKEDSPDPQLARTSQTAGLNIYPFKFHTGRMELDERRQ